MSMSGGLSAAHHPRWAAHAMSLGYKVPEGGVYRVVFQGRYEGLLSGYQEFIATTP